MNNKPDGPGNKIEHEDHLIGRKDAFHVSAVLCENREEHRFVPGQPVVFTGDAYSRVRPAVFGEVAHGIVDPFIDGTIGVEDVLFWVIIRPGYTTGVRHDFEIKLPVTGADFQKGQWDCRGC